MVSFVNMTAERKRVDCAIKHSEGRFPRKDKCIKREEIKPKCNDGETIYSRKHVLWINSAIRTVESKVFKHGLDFSHMKTYENTVVKLKYC